MEEVLDGLHVLVVDDEPDVRRATVQLLRSHGAKAVVAANAADALDILELHLGILDIDVVVSDIDMPSHDGFWLIGELRSRPSLQSVPAIAFTGRGSGDRQRILDAGFSAHVVKTNPDMLCGTIQTLRQRAAG
jgi:CheY-like chemotaxis protein